MAVPITHVLSHFGQAFSFCSMSANEFYSLVEKIVITHEFPDVRIKRVNNKEGGMLSSSREYLRIKHKELVYEICAMQFGKDFCITAWLYDIESGLNTLFKYTWAGNYLSNRAKKRTFYQADQEAMFKFCVHNSLLEAIDSMTSSQGLRKMTDAERQMK